MINLTVRRFTSLGSAGYIIEAGKQALLAAHVAFRQAFVAHYHVPAAVSDQANGTVLT